MNARNVSVIGIGAGSPKHLTLQAIEALGDLDVVLVADKGDTKDELVALRRAILQAHAPSVRLVVVPDPERGVDADRDRAAYERGVADWHAARADRYAEVIAALPSEATVGFLVWGDPAFYDSTIRVVGAINERIPLSVRVIAGIAAPQVLAAEHGIVLNAVGGPVHITTGRRLLKEYSPSLGTVVVMLDGGLHCLQLLDRWPELVIHWGAYLGMPQQVLRSGRLSDLAAELVGLRGRLRAEHGWIMDTYALS